MPNQSGSKGAQSIVGHLMKIGLKKLVTSVSYSSHTDDELCTINYFLQNKHAQNTDKQYRQVLDNVGRARELSSAIDMSK